MSVLNSPPHGDWVTRMFPGTSLWLRDPGEFFTEKFYRIFIHQCAFRFAPGNFTANITIRTIPTIQRQKITVTHSTLPPHTTVREQSSRLVASIFKQKNANTVWWNFCSVVPHRRTVIRMTYEGEVSSFTDQLYTTEIEGKKRSSWLESRTPKISNGVLSTCTNCPGFCEVEAHACGLVQGVKLYTNEVVRQRSSWRRINDRHEPTWKLWMIVNAISGWIKSYYIQGDLEDDLPTPSFVWPCQYWAGNELFEV